MPHWSKTDKADEVRAKIAQHHLGHKHSPETIQKMRLVKLGKKHSKEARKNMSIARTGYKLPNNSGERHGAWKGDNVGYDALHDWVKRILGTPCKCTYCGLDKKERMYHWANIGHAYKRNLKDWVRLCCSCHKLYDMGKIKIAF
jgi:hypothetical protein